MNRLSGLETFKKALDASQVLWGLICVHGVDVRANVESVRRKLVQINWVGSGVKPMARSNALGGKAKVGKLIKGVAATIDATELFSGQEIVDKLCAAGGAHKPTYYSFGDEKIDLGFYDPANK